MDLWVEILRVIGLILTAGGGAYVLVHRIRSNRTGLVKVIVLDRGGMPVRVRLVGPDVETGLPPDVTSFNENGVWTKRSRGIARVPRSWIRKEVSVRDETGREIMCIEKLKVKRGGYVRIRLP